VLASISGFVVPPVSSVSAESPTPIEVRVIGYSVNNEPLIAKRFGTPGGKVVVAVGSIHGHEKTGIRIVREMQLQPVSPEYDLWVIDTANPDGNRANTRQNANGVDLNRNFPKFWSKKTCPSKYCSGKRPGSEPETRALMKFFKEISPQLVVFTTLKVKFWCFHPTELPNHERFVHTVGCCHFKLQTISAACLIAQEMRRST